MIDVDKAIASAVKTGKASFGANSVVQSVKTGKTRLVILSSTCPKNIREDIEYYCKLSNIPLITYKGSSTDLATLCGKPFIVSTLSIREPGDSEILKLTETEKTESETSYGGSK